MKKIILLLLVCLLVEKGHRNEFRASEVENNVSNYNTLLNTEDDSNTLADQGQGREFLAGGKVLKSGNYKILTDYYLKESHKLYGQGNYDSCIFYLQYSLMYAEELQDSEYLSKIYNNLGLVYKEIGEYQLSVEYLDNSYQLKKLYGDEEGQANTLNNIGLVQMELGNYAQSVHSLKHSLQLKFKLNKYDRMASTLSNFGVLFQRIEEYEKAIYFYSKAVQIEELNQNETAIPNYLLNIGLAKKELGEIDLAMSYYQRALKHATELGQLNDIAKSNMLIGSVCLDREEFEKAREFYLKAEKVYADIHDNGGLINAQYNLGSTYLKLEKRDSAEICFSSSYQLAVESNLKENIAKASLELYQIYKDKENQQQALNYLETNKVYSDSLSSLENMSSLAQLDSDFDQERNEYQIHNLQRMGNTKSTLLSKQNQMIYALILILISVVLTTVWLIRKKQMNRRILEQLNVQQKQSHQSQIKRFKLDIELKNKELTSNVLLLNKKNEIIEKTIKDLKKHKLGLKGDEIKKMSSIISELRSHASSGLWEEFEKRFQEVHADFYYNLSQQFPNLSPNERKLCAFLKLNMSTKDITSITGQSQHSVNVARTRLRKKLGLSNSGVNVISFLSAL